MLIRENITWQIGIDWRCFLKWWLLGTRLIDSLPMWNVYGEIRVSKNGSDKSASESKTNWSTMRLYCAYVLRDCVVTKKSERFKYLYSYLVFFYILLLVIYIYYIYRVYIESTKTTIFFFYEQKYMESQCVVLVQLWEVDRRTWRTRILNRISLNQR